jgi:hypothetical protein
MASAQVDWVTIQKVLNHKMKGPTDIYVRYGYDNEKRIALNAWARRLHAIIDETAIDNVVPITSRRA